MHPNFVKQASELETFCQDCKLVAPLSVSGALGLVFRVHRRRHSCACVLFWLCCRLNGASGVCISSLRS